MDWINESASEHGSIRGISFADLYDAMLDISEIVSVFSFLGMTLNEHPLEEQTEHDGDTFITRTTVTCRFPDHKDAHMYPDDQWLSRSHTHQPTPFRWSMSITYRRTDSDDFDFEHSFHRTDRHDNLLPRATARQMRDTVHFCSYIGAPRAISEFVALWEAIKTAKGASLTKAGWLGSHLGMYIKCCEAFCYRDKRVSASEVTRMFARAESVEGLLENLTCSQCGSVGQSIIKPDMGHSIVVPRPMTTVLKRLF